MAKNSLIYSLNLMDIILFYIFNYLQDNVQFEPIRYIVLDLNPIFIICQY